MKKIFILPYSAMLKLLLIIFLIHLLPGCDKPEVYSTQGGFPDSPVNLKFLNSEYDDYNSNIPPGEYNSITFIFSSNRNSKGADFDLILYTLIVNYPFETEVLAFGESYGITTVHSDLRPIDSLYNTSANEFGPYIYNDSDPNNLHIDGWSEYFLFYTQEKEGQLDIIYLYNKFNEIQTIHDRFHWVGPNPVTSLNTGKYNEGYISIEGDSLYYCSDVNGDFDIFIKTVPDSLSVLEFVDEPNDGVYVPVEILNSNGDDKCPYVVGDFMVFTSNRPGGFGGYDLYYSKKVNGEWSSPSNFGSTINTEYDEYRPIVSRYDSIRNDLMIFSSNRPKGLGGFDLYYVGITESK